MGQENSAPSRNRLSKPRTNNSALNLLSRSALKLDRKDGRDAPLEDVPGHENRYSVIFANSEVRVDTVNGEERPKESKRRSIFRSFSTPDRNQATKAQQEVQEGSEVYQWSDPSKKASIIEEIQFYEERTRPVIRSRISLQHVPNAQSQQRLSLVAEVLTPAEELPNRLSTYAQLRSPELTNPVYTRTNSETDLYPMRRKSLLQHGVATRPVIPNDARQSLPSQARLEDPFTSNPAKPFAYLASLKAGDMPRVETPDELGYRHTGAFKLGSLVITNGVASPTPSVERAATMGGEDYISAGNLRMLREGHRRDASNRSNTMSVAGERMKTQWAVQKESPLRQATKYDVVSPKLPDLNRSLANFDFDYTHQLQQQMHSPTRSQDLANEYIEEISSPYSFVPSRTPSPQFEHPSKHNAMDDELFDEGSLTPSLSHAPSSADSGYGGPSRKSSAVEKKSLAKADSGYSSNMSLRSFKTTGSRAPPVPAKDITPPRESRDPSRTFSSSRNENMKTMNSLSNDYMSLNTQKVEQPIAPKTPPKEHQPPAARRPSLADIRSYNKHSRSGSDPKPLAVSLLASRKAKPRPYSIQPEMSQIYTQSQRRDEPIYAPPIPYEASRSLQDRGESSLNIRPRRAGSKETLRTIFSVGSGHTDIPRGQEITKSRLQEALPAPPTPLRKAISISKTSTNNSNSYHPPKTPPRKLQKKPSIQDMVAYQQLDLSMTRQISHQSIRSSIGGAMDRSSMASEIEVKTATALTMRNISAESETSIALTHKQSFSSIVSRNPYSSRKNSLDTLPSARNKKLNSHEPQSRKSSLDSLPSRKAAPIRKDSVDSLLAAQHQSRACQDSLDNLSRQNPRVWKGSVDSLPLRELSNNLTVAPETIRRLSWGNRDKQPPPVSMQTQRKITPIPQPTYNLFPSPPRRPHLNPLTPISKDLPKITLPDRPPPPLPQKSPFLPAVAAQEILFPPLLPSHQDSPRDPWADQKTFWRNSENSIDRPSLKTRSSMNSIERPSLTSRDSGNSNRNSTSTLQSRGGGRRPPSVHQNSNLRIQKNMEAVKARMYLENKMYMQSTPDLLDGQYGAVEQARQNRERDKAGEMLAGWTLSPGGTTPGEYHHTYGFQVPAPPHRAPSPEKEYFSQSEEGFSYGDYHQRQNSTSHMLMLDQFSGALDFRLGARKGSKTRQGYSEDYGVDFGDVPIFMARTPDGLRG